jgi:hypothetical protein
MFTTILCKALNDIWKELSWPIFGEKGTENIAQRENKLDFNVVSYQHILAKY